MPTPTELLDLAPGVGQRQATFLFRLVDAATNRPLGDLHPQRTPPQLDHDTTRTICRTLTGLNLDKTETAQINTVTDRVAPAMVVGGQEFPLGTYVFTDAQKTRSTGGRLGEYGLSDVSDVVAQKTLYTTSFTRNTNVGDAISQVLASVAGLPAGYVVESTGAVIGSPVAWPAGTDRGRILTDLCAMGAYLAPYMDNQSIIRVRQSFDPALAAPAFAFVEGGNVRAGTIQESDDLLEAANAFVVTDNANTANPIVGRYDVPISAPHSAAARGFVVAEFVDMQGVGSSAAAEAAARAYGLAQTIHQKTTVSTSPDPRHDGYDVVRYDGANWLETAWTLPLLEGAEMTHTLTRAYPSGLAPEDSPNA